MNICFTSVRMSSGSPVATNRLANFPTSSDPTRSDTPQISAGHTVNALTASSFDNPPYATAIAAMNGRSHTCAESSLANANFTPALASAAGSSCGRS